MVLFSVSTLSGSYEFKAKFSDIVKEYSDMVYRICYVYLKNKSDAEDAYQDTFLKLYTSYNDFDNTDHLRAWLITTSGNICKNMLDKAKVRTHDELNEELCGMIDDTMKRDVVFAVMQLPVMYKQIVYLYYYEGYSTAEIARIEDCKEPTVRTRLARAREMLKAQLSEYMG
ncbi:MAG: RNA polymerase sigma factor [Acutalibacteraceae bacterium]